MAVSYMYLLGREVSTILIIRMSQPLDRMRSLFSIISYCVSFTDMIYFLFCMVHARRSGCFENGDIYSCMTFLWPDT